MLNPLFEGGITLKFRDADDDSPGCEGEEARVTISAIVGMGVGGCEAEARGMEATEESNHPLFLFLYILCVV
jgi:hypothetical protein